MTRFTNEMRETTKGLSLDELKKQLKDSKRQYRLHGALMVACMVVWVLWSFSILPGKVALVSVPIFLILFCLWGLTSRAIPAYTILIHERSESDV